MKRLAHKVVSLPMLLSGFGMQVGRPGLLVRLRGGPVWLVLGNQEPRELPKLGERVVWISLN